MGSKILFVDDRWKEEGWKEVLDERLSGALEVIYEEYGYKALHRLKANPDIKLVLLDLKFEGQPKQGEEILNEIKEHFPEMPVIILTSVNDVQLALRLVVKEKKAYYYFLKGEIDYDQLFKEIENAISYYELKTDSIRKTEIGSIIGESPAIKEVLKLIGKAAQVDTTVLITGETGTGKELVAKAIHENSPRKKGRFIAVNCAAIPETLLESELFGYAPRSGIAGADPKGKPGKFELADGGSVFLDEIGDMSLATQAKILRVLQEREFERVGGTKSIRVDIRIIAATNRDLEEMVRERSFRNDLYYRLNVLHIHIPLLRQRREDIPLLVRYITDKFNSRLKMAKEVSEESLGLFSSYDWPGNIREMENALERAMVESSSNVLGRQDFASLISSGDKGVDTAVGLWVERVFDSKAKWEDIKKEFGASGNTRREILEALILRLKKEKGRRPSGKDVAEMLGVRRNHLNQVLKSLDLSLKDYG